MLPCIENYLPAAVVKETTPRLFVVRLMSSRFFWNVKEHTNECYQQWVSPIQELYKGRVTLRTELKFSRLSGEGRFPGNENELDSTTIAYHVTSGMCPLQNNVFCQHVESPSSFCHCLVYRFSPTSFHYLAFIIALL